VTWRDRAACRNMDPVLWHPTAWHRSGRWRRHSVGPADSADVAAAKRVCAACPVRLDCLSHAVAVGEQDGIWGGLTPDERDAL